MSSRAFGSGKRAAAIEARNVEDWNKRNPVGTEVIVIEDDRHETWTSTVSVAWLLGGHTAVIALADRSGCYRLGRVRRANAATLVEVMP